VGGAGGGAEGPNYKRPPVPMTAFFRGQSAAQAESFADLPWWEVYQDPDLAALIRVALTTGYDIRVAISRVEQARAGVGIATDAFLPNLSLSGSATYLQIFSPISAAGIPGLPTTGNPRFWDYTIRSALSWE